MKPKPIVMKPEIPITRDSLMSKKMSLETPMGTLESDSGNHYIDVLSIIFVIAVLYVGKKMIDKKMDKFRL